MYVVKDDNFEALKQFGFVDDKQAIFPTQLIKRIDKTTSIKVCNDPERSYNVWTREDWKDVGILYLWNEKGDRCFGTRNTDEVSPYVQDLIDNEVIVLK